MRELDLKERVLLSRLGGKVERCHIIPHERPYNNAAHSWGVAMLMLQLFPEDFPRLAAYCICHDVPEAWVGDVPAHTKHRAPAIAEALREMESGIFTRLQLPDENDLSAEDKQKLKACDALELYLWACDEVTLGNHHAQEILRKLHGWFRSAEHRPLPQVAYDLFASLGGGNTYIDKELAMEGY